MALRSQVTGDMRLSARRIRVLLTAQPPLTRHHEPRRGMVYPSMIGQGHLGRREFSVAPYIDTALTGTQHLISQLHVVTGTPWFVTIPLVALSVSLIARLPLRVHQQRIIQRQSQLLPLLRAWNIRHMRDAGTAGHLTREESEKAAADRYNKTLKRVYKAWGVQQWKSYSSILSFPFWLVAIESLRRLCGGPRGLLGMMLFGPPNGATTANQDAGADSAIAAPGAGGAGDHVVATAGGPLTHGPFEIDPSLADGGCLWFSDLTAADPTGALPLMLSAVLVINLLPRTAAGRQQLFGYDLQRSSNPTSTSAPDRMLLQSKGRIRLQRALIGVGLVIGPATMGLPAALHLYWISSAMIGLISNEAIMQFMKPSKSTVLPCKGNEALYIRPAR